MIHSHFANFVLQLFIVPQKFFVAHNNCVCPSIMPTIRIASNKRKSVEWDNARQGSFCNITRR